MQKSTFNDIEGIMVTTHYADPEIFIRRARIEAPRGNPPSSEKFLDFASKMATFGAFWALSFTVCMHVLHVKKQRFELEIGGQIHKLGVLSSRSTETANDTRNSLMTDDTYYVQPIIFFQ